jgi:hypothetical protein
MFIEWNPGKEGGGQGSHYDPWAFLGIYDRTKNPAIVAMPTRKGSIQLPSTSPYHGQRKKTP